MTAEVVTASVHIDAPPERVYEYFTRPEAIVRWMGDYARLEPEPGGQFTVDVNGAPVRGRFRLLDPPHRLVISWGYAARSACRRGPAHRTCGLSPRTPVPASTSSIATCQVTNSPDTRPAGPITWPARRGPDGDPGPDPGMIEALQKTTVIVGASFGDAA